MAARAPLRFQTIRILTLYAIHTGRAVRNLAKASRSPADADDALLAAHVLHEPRRRRGQARAGGR